MLANRQGFEVALFQKAKSNFQASKPRVGLPRLQFTHDETRVLVARKSPRPKLFEPPGRKAQATNSKTSEEFPPVCRVCDARLLQIKCFVTLNHRLVLPSKNFSGFASLV